MTRWLGTWQGYTAPTLSALSPGSTAVKSSSPNTALERQSPPNHGLFTDLHGRRGAFALVRAYVLTLLHVPLQRVRDRLRPERGSSGDATAAGRDSVTNLLDEPPDHAVGASRAELRRAAASVREIAERIADADLGEADARELRERLEAVARFAASAARARNDDGLRDSEGHPWAGLGNPIAPPMRFHLEASPDDLDGRALVAEVVCGRQYSLDGSVVHGGVVAGLFDTVLAVRASMPGGALTVQLDVRYVAPTPTDQPLRLDAVLERVDGRKRFLRATLAAGGVVRAEAKAIFVAVAR